MPLGDSTIAVVLGASEWPKYDTLDASPWFKDSAESFRDYLLSPKGLRIPTSNVLYLFDQDLHPGDVGERIRQFISERLKANPNISDVIFYYVGHGGYLNEREYFLALRTTSKNFKDATVFKISYLVGVLGELTREKRNLVILDACYSAGALGEFSHMAENEDAVGLVHDQVSARLPPSEGTVLFCAAGPKKWAKVSLEGPHTMFSGALLKVLEGGEPTGGAFLTLQRTAELVKKEIEQSFGTDGARPQVHVPVQNGETILTVPFFPNPAYSVADLEGRLGHLEKSLQELTAISHQFKLSAQRSLDLEQRLQEFDKKIVELPRFNSEAEFSAYGSLHRDTPLDVRAFLEDRRGRTYTEAVLLAVAAIFSMIGIASIFLYSYAVGVGDGVLPRGSAVFLMVAQVLGVISLVLAAAMLGGIGRGSRDYWHQLEATVKRYVGDIPRTQSKASDLQWAEYPRVLEAFKRKYVTVPVFGEIDNPTAILCFFLFLTGFVGVVPVYGGVLFGEGPFSLFGVLQ